jgi:hypothetical protein
MRKSRRLVIGIAVSSLVAAGGITFGLIANANSQGFCDSSASPGTTSAPITCTLPNSTDTDTTINTPSAIQAIVTLESGDGATTPDQYIAVTYSLFCTEGGDQATTTQATSPALPAEQAIAVGTPVTDTLALGEPTPDSCTVESLTATLEVNTGTSAAPVYSPVTTGAFELELAWTPSGSSSSSSSTSTTTPPPSTTHVSTISGYDGKCIDDRGNSSSNRTPIIIWNCNSSDSAQGFTFSGGELKHNGRCVNIQGGAASGHHLILWSCNGASNEKWFHSTSDGEYVSAGTSHGLVCADDPAYSKTNGTQLIAYTCHNSSNQHWSS